jgi:hypothetical protein
MITSGGSIVCHNGPYNFYQDLPFHFFVAIQYFQRTCCLSPTINLDFSGSGLICNISQAIFARYALPKSIL